MINFLKETIADITEFGYMPEDIIFIGSEKSGHSCTWEEFLTLANFEYTRGLDSHKVARDLIIVFEGNRKMWRHGFNGGECWMYSRPFEEPNSNPKKIKRLIGDGKDYWQSLSELNKPEETQ